MVSKINSMGLAGVDAFIVEVEADVSRGMPTFDIVGLPDASVKEARNRVRAATLNCGFVFPINRITVNLAPADIKKIGAVYDLPIFISLLQASRQIDVNLNDAVFVGELSLSGELKPIDGILSMTIKAKELGFKKFFLPSENASEAGVIDDIAIYPVNAIKELINHFLKMQKILPVPKTLIKKKETNFKLDFSQVKGQSSAKRALEIAAAGGHNILLIGPPGSGKSMLAERIFSILPDMTFDEIIETTKIYSVAGQLTKETPLILERPFRAPHHTISSAKLSGGGSLPVPGEISLAHNGVLFLDELPEFPRNSLEILRKPIEDGTITISRIKQSLTYPCDVMLVCAMNPCPCGYFGHESQKCACSEITVSKYLSKISGPLLDRIDLHIEVPAINFENISSRKQEETSAAIRTRVDAARKIQTERYKNASLCNAKMSAGILQNVCSLSKNAEKILEVAFNNMGLSGRGYSKILKIARTIADLEGSEIIDETHISEAIQYRSLDRKYWNRKY